MGNAWKDLDEFAEEGWRNATTRMLSTQGGVQGFQKQVKNAEQGGRGARLYEAGLEC